MHIPGLNHGMFYILTLHGYNMLVSDTESWAANFKRRM